MDVTLTYNLKQDIINWRMLRNYNGTDHNTILFEINKASITIPEHRNYKKADCNKFRQELEHFEFVIVPSDTTESKLDKMLKRINIAINAALKKSCPLVKASTIDPHNAWWTNELTQLRREVSKLYDKHKNDRKNTTLQEQYKQKQKVYRKRCAKHKKQATKLKNESL